MKAKLFILSTAALGFFAGFALAYEGHDSGTHQGTSEHGGMMKEASSHEEPLSDAVEAGNKICPVTGQEIASMGGGIKYEHEGKIYSFCCPMCVGKFKKNPEKYIQIIEENMKEENKKQPW